MNTLVSLGLLCSLAGSSIALTCWNSDGFKAMRDTNVGKLRQTSINSKLLRPGYLAAGVPEQRQQVLLQGVVQGGQLGRLLLQPGLLQQRAQGRDGGEKGKYSLLQAEWT